METKTLSPADYLMQRSAELDHLELSLLEQLKWVQSERERLRRMADIAGVSLDTPEVHSGMQLNFDEAVQAAPVLQPGTMKAAVVQALKETGEGLSAQQILPIVNHILGKDYPRSSLSPQLSRLKYDGIITLRGGVWELSGQTETAPNDHH